MSGVRRPVAAYAAVQHDAAGVALSAIEVVVCDDGTVWTLRVGADGEQLVWSQDAVPPIPGTLATLTPCPATT